ncbi:hypothetical protein ACHAW6_003227 [Cyclotella cf. meneghiniana]
MIRSRLLMVRRLSHALHAVGSCVVNGKMEVLLGRSCPTSRSLTLFRLLSLHLPQELPMNQPQLVGVMDPQKERPAYLPGQTHKFGIKLPKTEEEAYAIDKATGTSFWSNVMEMKNVHVAFDICPDGVTPPSDH